MALTRKPGTAGVGSRIKPGADAPGPTGIRPDELYGDGLGDTPGTVGVNDAAAPTAQYLGSGSSKKTTRRRAALRLKVEIIEYPTRSIFTNKERNNIKAAVNSELKRIRKQLKQSKAQFTVSWSQPRRLTVTASTPKVLRVYVIENTQKAIQQAIKIRNAALPNTVRNDQELANHVASEAGYCARYVRGKVSVCFMSITTAQQYKAAGIKGVDKMFANIVLHEIGHAMDTDHPDKGVMRAKTVYDSRGGMLIQYSKKSIDKIDKFLSTL